MDLVQSQQNVQVPIIIIIYSRSDLYQRQIPEGFLLWTHILVKLLDVEQFGRFQTSYLSTGLIIDFTHTYMKKILAIRVNHNNLYLIAEFTEKLFNNSFIPQASSLKKNV